MDEDVVEGAHRNLDTVARLEELLAEDLASVEVVACDVAEHVVGYWNHSEDCI